LVPPPGRRARDLHALRVGSDIVRADPHDVAVPIVSVADATSCIVPPGSILPFHDAVATADTTIIWYGGDRGVALQHVGPLVGRRAHQHLWPRLLSWLHERSAAQ
jgi:polyhydroxyalkanoate synthase